MERMMETERVGADQWRLLLASAVGTLVEWYDFFIFATCAVLVFAGFRRLGDEPSGHAARAAARSSGARCAGST